MNRRPASGGFLRFAVAALGEPTSAWGKLREPPDPAPREAADTSGRDGRLGCMHEHRRGRAVHEDQQRGERGHGDFGWRLHGHPLRRRRYAHKHRGRSDGRGTRGPRRSSSATAGRHCRIRVGRVYAGVGICTETRQTSCCATPNASPIERACGPRPSSIPAVLRSRSSSRGPALTTCSRSERPRPGGWGGAC